MNVSGFFSSKGDSGSSEVVQRRRSSAAPGAPSRLSVRGAFGPSGGLWQGRRKSSDQLSKAQVFQLDRCLDAKTLDKLIFQMANTAETRKTSGLSSTDQGKLSYDIEGFAAYLRQQQALSTLLFWKDCEDFTAIFGSEDRSKAATKVYDRYLAPGAEYEVASISNEKRGGIKSQLADPPEELFLELQQEAYGSMLFELFPRFWDAVKQQEKQASSSRSKLTEKTTLKEILAANDLEIHLFAEYCREHMCEDSVIFLLETNLFSLLFDPSDLLAQGKRIYETYIDGGSEGRIAVSNHQERLIKATLDAAEKGSAGGGAQGTPAATSGAGGVTPSLFAGVIDEVMNTLNLDVWPVQGGRAPGAELRLTHVGASADGADGMTVDGVDMRVASRDAVAAALNNPEMLGPPADGGHVRASRSSSTFASTATATSCSSPRATGSRARRRSTTPTSRRGATRPSISRTR